VLCFLQNETILVILLVIPFFSAITKGELLPNASLSLEEIHLVRCLTHISHRYFAPGHSLVISSSATYRDVQQELIAEIERTSIWPIVVAVDGNISKPTNTDFIVRDVNYIILIPDGNIKILEAEFNGLAIDRTKFTRFWNSESRFVVPGANEFSMSQQIDIFDYLSKFRIYNCIIVNRGHYIIDQEHSRQITFNDVDTGMKFGVYTWFPYQSSDSCTEVNDITLLDSWVISAEGHFSKNTNLFPGKISSDLNECPMKAVVRDCYWNLATKFTEQRYSNGSVVTYVQGLEIDLLRLVLKQMNMIFIFVPAPFELNCFYGTTFSLILAIFEKKAYIFVGRVGTNFFSDPFLDSTNSYKMLSIGGMFRVQSKIQDGAACLEYCLGNCG